MKTVRVIVLALSLTCLLALPTSAQTGEVRQNDPKTLYQRGRAEQARSNLLAAVELYRAALGPAWKATAGEALGMGRMLEVLRHELPGVELGYFNPPVEPGLGLAH